jgi:hypothetical protein
MLLLHALCCNNFLYISSCVDASKRPPGWADLRLKRVMLLEHIDRIAGIDEANIVDLRADREIKVGRLRNSIDSN